MHNTKIYLLLCYFIILHLYLFVTNIHPATLLDLFHWFFLALLLPEQLNNGDQKNLCERNKLRKDKPQFNPLDIGGLGEPADHADQQGRHCQHHRQVHGDRSVEETRQSEEGGGVADNDQQQGWEKCFDSIICESPFESYF